MGPLIQCNFENEGDVDHVRGFSLFYCSTIMTYSLPLLYHAMHVCVHSNLTFWVFKSLT